MISKLPCWPCPHGSACCRFGTTVSEREAVGLVSRYGAHTILRKEDGELRTSLQDGRCIFSVANACVIHDDPDYPAVCIHFPWSDAETGGPYEGDLTICPSIRDKEDDRG